MGGSYRRSVVVVGLGSAFRGDDAAGLAVAARLREAGRADLRVVDGVAGGAGLLGCWGAEDEVGVVDAAQSGGEIGSVWRYDGLNDPIPERLFRASTHTLGLTEAISPARFAGCLPRRLAVIGINGGNFDPGAPMSPEVERSVEEVVMLILRECSAQNAG